MPELAEVKIMADYINSVTADLYFTEVQRSTQTKVKCEVESPFDSTPFKISAISRGKELMLLLQAGEETRSLIATMGMSGAWFLSGEESPKHSHLIFIREDGARLNLVDVRRFAKWKWSGWGKQRGPCPLTEHKDFVNWIGENLQSRAFKRPVFEVLMDQRYFNGIGNYLRAEILDRLDIDPFVSAATAVKTSQILAACHDVCLEAYLLGGGELKDWQNPFKLGAESKISDLQVGDFETWLQCYSKKTSIIDKNGRRFWLDEKWLKNEQHNSTQL